MAVLATTHPTLLDVSRRLDPGGKVDKIIEILNMTNEVIDDAVWIEGNLPTGNQSVIRTGLPTPTWRAMYGGVQPTKSTTAKIVDTCGMLEDYAEVDKALADLNGNTAEFRLSEDAAHLEGFNQKFTSTLFYGSEVSTPESFTGFAPRFNSLSANNGVNIITGSGTANTSIYLVVWGPNSVFCTYPKGSKAGLLHGGQGAGHDREYRWRRWPHGSLPHALPLGLRSGREGLALCGSRAGRYLDPDQERGVGRGYHRHYDPDDRVASEHGHRSPGVLREPEIRSFLRRQMVNKVAPGTLMMEDVAGRKVVTFDGIPVKRVDTLLNTEVAVA
jgi:hypothetical protein